MPASAPHLGLPSAHLLTALVLFRTASSSPMSPTLSYRRMVARMVARTVARIVAKGSFPHPTFLLGFFHGAQGTAAGFLTTLPAVTIQNVITKRKGGAGGCRIMLVS